MSNELNILYPAPSRHTIGGVTADVHLVKMRNAQAYAELVGALAPVLASPSEAATAAFCAKHGHALTELLADQTSLLIDQLAELTNNDAIMWLSAIMLSNAESFGHALPELVQNLSGGASSTSA